MTADALLARSEEHLPDDYRIGVDDIDHIAVPATMLADLHDPELIITPEYVGPARGTTNRRDRGAGRNGPDRRQAGHSDGAGHSDSAGQAGHRGSGPTVPSTSIRRWWWR
jgi:hypothetical protein